MLGVRLLSKMARLAPRPVLPSGSDSLAIYGREEAVRVAVVTVLGLDVSDGFSVLEVVRKALERTHRIVCVTDCDAFFALYRAGALIEHVPARSARLRCASDLRWSDYLRDRHDLLIAKWRPEVVLAYGDSFERIIELAVADESEAA